MSILINGMDMPTVDQGVRTINIYADGVVTNYAEEEIGEAIPVPPHGRLIDADELAARCDEPHWCVWLSEIEDAPTIIPAESEVNNG